MSSATIELSYLWFAEPCTADQCHFLLVPVPRLTVNLPRPSRGAQICQSIGAVGLIDDSLKYALDCANHSIPCILYGEYAWNRGVRVCTNSKHLRCFLIT